MFSLTKAAVAIFALLLEKAKCVQTFDSGGVQVSTPDVYFPNDDSVPVQPVTQTNPTDSTLVSST